MKKFHLYIKTHTPAPDFELENIEAKDLKGAIKKIQSEYDLDEQIIRDNIEEMED